MKTITLILLAFMFTNSATRAQDLQNTRLSKILFYNYNADKPKPDAVYEFFYDPAGNLQKINYYQDGKLFIVTDNFKYNTTGKLVFFDSKGVNKGTVPRHSSIDYDAQGRRLTKTETFLQDGKMVTGNVTHYHYKGDELTRIREQPTFAGHIFDTLRYKTGSDGYIITPGMNTAHPNPMAMVGNGEVDLADNAEWPVSKYFAENAVVYQPTFGTTTTQYQYDKKGLLTGTRWKYVTEKEKLLQSTGKTVYLYTTVNKKT